MASADGITSDGFLDGRVKLSQPAKGYRAGLDAVLLAASVSIPSGAGAVPSIFEAGCGAGAALLCAASRLNIAKFTGLEREPSAAAMARANASGNGMSDRVIVVEGDVGHPPLDLPYGTFDVAMCNPPFFDDARSLRTPSAAKAAALITDRPFDQWVRFMTRITKAGGYLYMIHRADRLKDILVAFDGRAADIGVLPLHPREGEPAKRIIVRATKAARASTRFLPGVVLHDATSQAYTPNIEAVLRGEAVLAPLFDAR